MLMIMNDVNLALTLLTAALISNSLITIISTPTPAPLMRIFLQCRAARYFNHGITPNANLFYIYFASPSFFKWMANFHRKLYQRPHRHCCSGACALILMSLLGLVHLLNAPMRTPRKPLYTIAPHPLLP